LVLVHFVRSLKWSFWWKVQIKMIILVEDGFVTTDPNKLSRVWHCLFA
jgi:hypothetical protein